MAEVQPQVIKGHHHLLLLVEWEDLGQFLVLAAEVGHYGPPRLYLIDEVHHLLRGGVLPGICFFLVASTESGFMDHQTRALSVVDEVLDWLSVTGVDDLVARAKALFGVEQTSVRLWAVIDLDRQDLVDVHLLSKHGSHLLRKGT